jgi:hypothetical protein
MVSTVGQTALIILIPVYRWNTRPAECTDSGNLDAQGQWLDVMFVVSVVVWVLSCFTVTGVNLHDAQKKEEELM